MDGSRGPEASLPAEGPRVVHGEAHMVVDVTRHNNDEEVTQDASGDKPTERDS